MIDTGLLYVANIFTNNTDIIPNPKNITYFVNEFEEMGLLPSHFTELVDSKPQNRLQLNSSHEEWRIKFLSDRTDIIKFVDTENVNKFFDDVIKIWGKINKENKKKSSRLGISAKFLCKEFSEQELLNIFNRVFKPMPFYNLEKPINWESQFISQIDRKIGEEDEKLNVIVSVKRVQGQYKKHEEFIDFDRIELNFSINTVANIDGILFDDAHIILFFEAMKSCLNELKEHTVNHLTS